MHLVLSLTLAIALLASSAHAQTVDLGYAVYQGVTDAATGVTSFRGIRYASPPTGKSRFQAPKRPESLSGVQLAKDQPPMCPQAGPGAAPTSPFTVKRDATPSISEDCLFVNVYVPAGVNSTSELPVIFWIHGGGYIFGSSAEYDGTNLVRESGGAVIVVTVQYRLGLFGFLAGEDVKQKGALNAGLLDQQFALRWVNKHIHSFGGDPSRVTIWGVSAGAGSVILHLIANGGKTEPPLFRAGISSSSFIQPIYEYSGRIPETIYSEVARETGCNNATDTFDCLVAADIDSLQAANVAVNAAGFAISVVTFPVIDGEFIRERPYKAISEGRFNADALLTVTNAFEGRIFVNSTFLANLTLPEYVRQLFPALNDTIARSAAAQYEGTGLNSVFDQAVAINSESLFKCPTYALLEAFSGSHYKGEFSIPPANHEDDVPYYFPSFGTPLFNNSQFTASFVQSFTAFAESLDPNNTPDPSNITPVWTEYSDTSTEMLFNRTDEGQPDIREITSDNGLLQRCRFWQSIALLTSQ